MELTASKNELTGRWTLEGVKPSAETFDAICDMLKQKFNFKLARYGDGEMNCMFGKKGRNCDGHEYFSDLGLALWNVITSHPTYMVGIQPLAYSINPEFFNNNFSHLNVYDADVLHSASIDGKMDRFFEALEDRSILVVGPWHLNQLAFVRPQAFLGTRHIPVPDINCWEKRYQIVDEIENSLKENDVVLLCASMMSEVLIDRFRNHNSTWIDCGSVFDPYCNVKSRSYHHKLKL
jgi:hypothetical protein